MNLLRTILASGLLLAAAAGCSSDEADRARAKITGRHGGYRVTFAIAGYSQPADTSGIIAALEERVDPQGMLDLRWQRSGDTLSVFVPATSAEAQAAGVAYYEALDRLGELKRQAAGAAATQPLAGDPVTDLAGLFAAWTKIRHPSDDPNTLIRVAANARGLAFRIAPSPPQGPGGLSISMAQVRQFTIELAERGPEAGRNSDAMFQWFKIRDPQQAERLGRHLVVSEWVGDAYLLLSNRPGDRLVRGKGEPRWELSGAERDYDPNTAAPTVLFTLDDRGAKLFGELTGNHIGDALALLLDNEVVSAPTIQSRIGRQGIITGRFTNKEIDGLIRTLKAGAVDADLRPVLIELIGPGPQGDRPVILSWRPDVVEGARQ